MFNIYLLDPYWSQKKRILFFKFSDTLCCVILYFHSFIRERSHSSHWWAKPFVALVNEAICRIWIVRASLKAPFVFAIGSFILFIRHPLLCHCFFCRAKPFVAFIGPFVPLKSKTPFDFEGLFVSRIFGSTRFLVVIGGNSLWGLVSKAWCSLAIKRARLNLLLARDICEQSEIYCSLAVRASEARFIAHSLLERAKRDLLLARC